MLSLLLIIGIVGYFSVPTVANFIVHAHGGNGMLQRVNSISAGTTATVVSASTAVGSRMAEGAQNLANFPKHVMEGYNNGGSDHQKERLSGKTN